MSLKEWAWDIGAFLALLGAVAAWFLIPWWTGMMVGGGLFAIWWFLTFMEPEDRESKPQAREPEQ